MTFWQEILSRRHDLWQALGQHIEISLISLLVALVIAIPVAIWAKNHRRFAEVILQITSVLQTIPSLALLGLLIPIVGIGSVPAIIALVVYALLPIFQNTYTGLTEIDPSLLEAADAFGMSTVRKLFKVEFPLAMPMIISGVRTALVQIIGTATLAALIGAGGLGSFILLGIDRNNTNLILIGAILSALLAIVLSLFIQWLQKGTWKRAITALTILAAVGGGFGLYQLVKPKTETITIAGKMGSEPEILINMYAQLIEAQNSHIQVELKPNFGKTSFLFSALKNKQIDIYPEFTGTVLESLVRVSDQQKTQNLTAAETYQLAKKRLAQQDGLTFLKPMAYQNTYALAVTRQFAKAHHLSTISDLASIQNEIHAGFTAEFIDRSDGYKGLKKTYQLNFGQPQSFEPKLRYEAIHNGDINLVDAYSTDSELAEYHLQILKDDLHLFTNYQGAPLMQTSFAEHHQQIVHTLNQLSGKITEKQMQQMNYEVNVKQRNPATVARQYLTAHHLLKEGTS